MKRVKFPIILFYKFTEYFTIRLCSFWPKLSFEISNSRPVTYRTLPIVSDIFSASLISVDRWTWGRIHIELHGGWDPMPEVTITSPCVNSRVDSNTFTLGNPMPESTLTLCQSRLYPPVRNFGFGLWSYCHHYIKSARVQYNLCLGGLICLCFQKLCIHFTCSHLHVSERRS